MFVSDRDEELLFRSRQLETIAWCSERLRRKDPAGSLRTAVLRPALVNIEAQNQGSWNYEVKDPRGRSLVFAKNALRYSEYDEI